MRRLGPLTLAVLLALGGLALAEAEPPGPRSAGHRDDPGFPAAVGQGLASPSPRPPDVPVAAPLPPGEGGEEVALPTVSLGGAALRLFGATAGVGLLLAACLLGYRRFVLRGRPARGADGRRLGWLSRWVEVTPAGDAAIEVVSRSYLGARESVGVIQVGRERFLVGITASGISLLARLAAAGEGRDEPAEPRAREFAAELGDAVTPRVVARPRVDLAETAIRSAVARSRDRLARAGRLTAVPGGGRD